MVSKLTIAKSRERVGLPRREGDVAEDAVDQPIAVARPKATPELPEGIWRRPAWEPSSTQSPAIQRTPIQELEAAVREHPANPAPYLELAALYLERERDYDAERLLARGREATAGDLRVLQLWEDVVMRRLEKKVSGAREAAEADDTPQSRAALEAARDERDRLETEILASRCRRDPANAAIRYQLGLRLKRAGKLREACVSLQQALADPQQKPLAALAMGECHEELHEIPEALKHYRMAAESAQLPAQLDCKKQALYDAGRLVTGMNLPRLAQRYLGELLRLEPQHPQAAGLLARLRPAAALSDGSD
jgi:tetratricopeptide (TPR) repeat protein